MKPSSIAFPDDWNVDDENEQTLSVAPEDELVAAELLALEADEAVGALAEAKVALKDEFEGLEMDEVQKGEVNGLRRWSWESSFHNTQNLRGIRWNIVYFKGGMRPFQCLTKLSGSDDLRARDCRSQNRSFSLFIKVLNWPRE